MREILFRGKRKNNEEWVHGDLWCNPYGKRVVCIVSPINNQGTTGGNEVDTETVGQYTGFTDKNGAKIFEGDILAFDDMDGSKGIYEDFYDGNNGKFAIAASGNRNYVDDFELFDELFERNEYFKWFTVIGNIYDSPELLKE